MVCVSLDPCRKRSSSGLSFTTFECCFLTLAVLVTPSAAPTELVANHSPADTNTAAYNLVEKNFMPTLFALFLPKTALVY